jgi:coenzyme F420-reducing hydrogenase delta subunit/ferredoxin
MTDVGLTGVEREGGPSVPENWQPRIFALVCNWCSYAGADMAGTTRLEYPANVRMIRFPCTGRMSPLMIIRAFEQGADGVLVSGCHPGDCHYVQGNLVARRRFTIFRSLMDFVGIDLKRLHFAWVSAAEGHKWAQVVREVTEAVTEAGPLPVFDTAKSSVDVELPGVPDGGGPELSIEEIGAVQEHLRQVVAELLTDGRVDTVIGCREGSMPGRAVPVTIDAPEEASQLVWSQGCLSSLATYLLAALKRSKSVGLVVKTCDLGAVAGLIREGQVPRDRMMLIGAQCPGVRVGGDIAAKCLSCSGSPHAMCDLVVTAEGVGENCPAPADDEGVSPRPRDEQIAYLESLPVADRWQYWQRQFTRCLRCYACRAACPLCYCSSCISEKHRPQWISPVIDGRGNSAWNIIRAFHLAGRCSGCDECARACPADIRLDLINRKLELEVERHFGEVGLDPEEKSALIDFREDDNEEFVL